MPAWKLIQTRFESIRLNGPTIGGTNKERPKTTEGAARVTSSFNTGAPGSTRHA